MILHFVLQLEHSRPANRLGLNCQRNRMDDKEHAHNLQ